MFGIVTLVLTNSDDVNCSCVMLINFYYTIHLQLTYLHIWWEEKKKTFNHFRINFMVVWAHRIIHTKRKIIENWIYIIWVCVCVSARVSSSTCGSFMRKGRARQYSHICYRRMRKWKCFLKWKDCMCGKRKETMKFTFHVRLFFFIIIIIIITGYNFQFPWKSDLYWLNAFSSI